MSRFDFVKYDEKASQLSNKYKEIFQNLESQLKADLGEGRSLSTALTKLEETFMWTGKAVRDDQITRNGSAELETFKK
jgi:hypothetical protein